MERARYLYLHAAIMWARTPRIVRAMVRHPFLTIAPAVIIILLVTAAFVQPATMESPTMHIIPSTQVAP